MHEVFLLAADAEAAHAEAKRLFAEWAAALVPVLPMTAELRHIGATSVPGCLTKGDLDIVVRVPAVDFASAEAALARRFARNAGSVRMGDFSSFEAPNHIPPVGIQLTVMGGTFDAFHHFTDALRADPDRLQRYNDLKRAFHGLPMDAYRAAKHAFIDETLRAASIGAPGRAQA